MLPSAVFEILYPADDDEMRIAGKIDQGFMHPDVAEI